MKKILLIALLSTSYSFSQCFVQIVSGEQHTIAIADDGTLWGWGSNSSGEAGISASYPSHVNVPTQIGTATNWTDIECGSYHSMALNTDDELYTWGYNVQGQLGTGDYNVRTSPTLINGSWKAIGAGTYHSFAITTGGNLYGTGAGDNGQLGDNTTNSYNQFTLVASGTDWKDIAGGANFSLALRTDGLLFATGNNGNGQFGNGGTFPSDYWSVTAESVTGWESIDAGFYFAMGRTSAGTLYSWGNNLNGQLGQNGTTQQVTPQPVDINITDFACGAYASIWMKSTTVYSAGKNGFNQAQSGTTNDVTTPYQWTTFSNPELVTMGIFSSTVVTTGGLYAWGRNDRGVCGNGDFTNVITPNLALACTVASVQDSEGFDGTVYPNPAQDVLNIELSELSSIIVSDINGKQLLTSESNTAHSINVAHLKSGVYFIRTENGATQKFIKK
jgi:alpha-tubulin suppressor-like RCC1 family protein